MAANLTTLLSRSIPGVAVTVLLLQRDTLNRAANSALEGLGGERLQLYYNLKINFLKKVFNRELPRSFSG